MNRFSLTLMSLLALSPTLMASSPAVPHTSRTEALADRSSARKAPAAKPQGRANKPTRLAGVGNASLAGNLIYSAYWGETDNFGLYRLNIGGGEAIPEPMRINNLYAGGGGVYIPSEDVYVAVTYQMALGMISKAQIEVFDANTWDLITYYPCSVRCVAFDLEYNPIDGKVYGAFLTDEAQSGVYFGTFDYKTGTTKQISNITIPYAALMADGSGDLYGIEAATGNLYRVSTNGKRQPIGNTGYSPSYLQSGTFDYKEGKAYWCASSDDSAALYTVNLETAELTEVADWKEALLEWVGLFSTSQYAPAGAPAAAESISIAFDGTTTAATCSFTAPAVTNDGAALSGEITYTIYVDGESLTTGSATSGAEVKAPFTALEGMHTYALTLSNDKGASPFVVAKAFCGLDTPSAVTNAVSSITDAGVEITWDEVTSAAHNGYINLSDLTYKVTRLPDGLVVAENIKDTKTVDTNAPDKLARYRYQVVAVSGGLESEPVETEGVVRGNPMQPGFVSNFDDPEERVLYTIIDANEDSATWIEKEDNGTMCFRYRYSEEGYSADDWVVSPPFMLEKGKSYKIITGAEYVGEGEEIEVKAGRAPEEKALTIPVASSEQVPLIDDITELFTSPFVYFTPEESGVYYFGFHAISLPNRFYLFLRRWAIEEGVNPAAPTEVTAKAQPEPKGERFATLTITAPERTCDGSALTSIDRIEVKNILMGYTNTISNPEPGKEYTIDDTEVGEGLTLYDITAYNAAGNGRTLRETCWVGMDYPAQVIDPYWVADGNNVRISWEAPQIGEHGGYIDPSILTYRVVTYYPEVDFLESRWPETAYTDTSIGELDSQISLYYNIAARSPKGVGEQHITNAGPFGKPYYPPFTDSFRDGSLDHTGWGFSDPNITVAHPFWQSAPEGYFDDTMQPVDNDGGLLYFYSNLGGENLLFSPMIHIWGGEPTLKFFCRQPDADTEVEILISTDCARTWSHLLTTSPANEWKEYTADLSAYADKNICLGIRGKANYGSVGMAIDNIRIDADLTGLADIDVDREVDVKWFTPAGIEVQVPAKGDVLIRVATDARGRRSARKVIVK